MSGSAKTLACTSYKQGSLSKGACAKRQQKTFCWRFCFFSLAMWQSEEGFPCHQSREIAKREGILWELLRGHENLNAFGKQHVKRSVQWWEPARLTGLSTDHVPLPVRMRIWGQDTLLEFPKEHEILQVQHQSKVYTQEKTERKKFQIRFCHTELVIKLPCRTQLTQCTLENP